MQKRARPVREKASSRSKGAAAAAAAAAAADVTKGGGKAGAKPQKRETKNRHGGFQVPVSTRMAASSAAQSSRCCICAAAVGPAEPPCFCFWFAALETTAVAGEAVCRAAVCDRGPAVEILDAW